MYVGRQNNNHRLAGHDLFANAYKIGRNGTRDDVLELFERDLRRILELYPKGLYAKELAELRGKTLACWCAPRDGRLTPEDETVCHAQILLKLAEELT